MITSFYVSLPTCFLPSSSWSVYQSPRLFDICSPFSEPKCISHSTSSSPPNQPTHTHHFERNYNYTETNQQTNKIIKHYYWLAKKLTNDTTSSKITHPTLTINLETFGASSGWSIGTGKVATVWSPHAGA